jgi:hypothetical protein
MKDHIFRLTVYVNDVLSETGEPLKFWVEAHTGALSYDDTYPEEYAIVQRSTDGGQTWENYSAEEYVGGKPAWVVHQQLWRDHMEKKE